MQLWYLSGAMTGYPNFNFDQFFDVEDALVDAGIVVASPARNDIRVLKEKFGPDYAYRSTPGFAEGDPKIYAEAIGTIDNLFAWDLAQIIEGDGIIMIPGWEKSTGARAERLVAEMCAKPVYLATLDSYGGWGWSLDPEQKRMWTVVQ